MTLTFKSKVLKKGQFKNILETVKKANYLGAYIIVRHLIGNFWEYIAFKDNEFYSVYITIKPKWYKLFSKNPYTEKEIKGICTWLVNAACATIETLNKKKLEEEAKKDDKGTKKPEKAI